MTESNFTGNAEKNITEQGFRIRIGNWLRQTSYKSFYGEIRKSVIGQDEALADVCLSIYLYLEKMAKGKHNSDAVLLSAPSGCGKTETYRAVKKYFERHLSFLPCYVCNCENLTESGFKGGDIFSVADGLMNASYTNGIGVVWLDEIDKKIMPSFDSHGDNINQKVQHGLLTVIEGCYIRDNNDKDSKPKQIQTNNTLFIGLGAFTDVRENKLRNRKHKLGFSSEVEEEITHYTDITREDLISAGGSYEFIGRFGTLISYRKLSDEAIRTIIEMMVKDESESIGIEIMIDESTVQQLLQESNSKFGCRLLRSMIHDRVMAQYKIIKMNYNNGDIERVFLSESGDSITLGTPQMIEHKPRKMFAVEA